MYRINDYLTPSERMDAIRVGGLKKLASLGMKPSDMEKDALSLADGASSILPLLGTAVRTAVVFGLPVGTVWYALSRSLKQDSASTQKLKAKLDHYNDVAEEAKSRVRSNTSY